MLDETRRLAPRRTATATRLVCDGDGELRRQLRGGRTYGTDGPGSTTYALTLTGSNVASGLFALGVNGAQGAPIVLNQVAATTSPARRAATEYFTISVDPGTGVVTFSQSQQHLARQHRQRRRYLDADTGERQPAAAGADGDGCRRRRDTASINLGTGVFQIEDDGPTVSGNQTVFTDDETATSPDDAPNFGGTDDYDGTIPSANLTGTLAHAYGTDGAGSTLLLDTNPTAGFTYALSSGGTVLTISQVQDGYPVDVMRVTLTNPTSGAYTVEQLNEIDHPTPGVSEENLLLNVNYRVTDARWRYRRRRAVDRCR